MICWLSPSNRYNFQFTIWNSFVMTKVPVLSEISSESLEAKSICCCFVQVVPIWNEVTLVPHIGLTDPPCASLLKVCIIYEHLKVVESQTPSFTDVPQVSPSSGHRRSQRLGPWKNLQREHFLTGNDYDVHWRAFFSHFRVAMPAQLRTPLLNHQGLTATIVQVGLFAKLHVQVQESGSPSNPHIPHSTSGSTPDQFLACLPPAIISWFVDVLPALSSSSCRLSMFGPAALKVELQWIPLFSFRRISLLSNDPETYLNRLSRGFHTVAFQARKSEPLLPLQNPSRTATHNQRCCTSPLFFPNSSNPRKMCLLLFISFQPHLPRSFSALLWNSMHNFASCSDVPFPLFLAFQ